MLNKVILIGYMGRDPEGRETSDGTKVANLSVATSSKYKGEDKTEWHRVTCFGKTAEFVLQYLTKGRLVAVEGRIAYGSYEKDGITRYTTDIIASRLQALDKKPVEQSSGNANAEKGTDTFTDDEVPF